MPKPFPIRSNSHQLEELSERYFRASLPKNWTADKPGADYGVDLRVEMFDGDQATGLELLVQLKSSTEASDGDFETVRLRVATYNYLWDKLQVAMLVKYIEGSNEAYWLLFRDIAPPTQEQDTFTVRIPKSNRVSALDWNEIQNYVRAVTDKKLAAMRREQYALRARDV